MIITFLLFSNTVFSTNISATNVFPLKKKEEVKSRINNAMKLLMKTVSQIHEARLKSQLFTKKKKRSKNLLRLEQNIPNSVR